MKKQILVTYWDRNIDPEIFEIKGKTEKELIYEIYEKSEKIHYALGDDDELLNEIFDGEISKDELLLKIEFETLKDFLKHLNSISQYYFREK
jgi:hypothetical protein